jgi:triosephosphate isomerase
MDLKNVDGVLVGGASLDALEYKKIMNSWWLILNNLIR